MFLNRFLKSKKSLAAAIALATIVAIFLIGREINPKKKGEDSTKRLPVIQVQIRWHAPDIKELPHGDSGDLIRYGKNLVANTAFYFGPKGTIAAISNGMNCQNCHLEAGMRLFGNNYSAVYSCYPKFRERSGTIEDICKRINDCMERSLNGKSLDTNGREMKAMCAYINWVGKGVPKNTKPTGAGIADLKFLEMAADTEKGHALYMLKCQQCHAANGEGLKKADQTGYTYPPLWGKYSYTTAAGLFRISRFAGFVKDNMPFGATHEKPLLGDDQVWNLAAFVNSQPRPEKSYAADWPNIAGKPIDYPFGPYADSFSENQHKYGPLAPIQLALQRKKKIQTR